MNAPRPEPRHDPTAERFVVALDEGEAWLQYHDAGAGPIEFSFTFVPPPARRHGVGAVLVRHAVAWAHGRGRAIRPTCGYVRTVMRREGLPTDPPA